MPTSSPDTSLSLLEQLREPGQSESWERLVSLYSSLLHTWFRSAGLQNADCDDLTQRVLEVLFRKIPAFEHNGRAGAFRTWLRRIAVNVLREFCRHRPVPGSEIMLDQLVDPHSGLSQLWDKQHDQHVLHGLLKVIEPEFAGPMWTAFRQLVFEGTPARQVAAELNTTVNAVLIAKSRVLARLRQEAAELID